MSKQSTGLSTFFLMNKSSSYDRNLPTLFCINGHPTAVNWFLLPYFSDFPF